MENSFAKLLTGKYDGATELEVSLKSCVPFFIIHPDLINHADFSIVDIAPYYYPDVNYNDKEEFVTLNYKRTKKIYLPNGEQEEVEDTYRDVSGLRFYGTHKPLLAAFTSLVRVVVQNAISGESKSEPTPRLSVLIDIGSTESKRRVISVPQEDINDFDKIKSSFYTLRDYQVASSDRPFTETQKSNIILINKLVREYSDEGTLGGS